MNVELPDLISIQKDSFKWFKEEGLKSLFKEYSPITDTSGRYEMYFNGYEFSTPDQSIVEAKKNDATYASALNVNVTMRFGKPGDKKQVLEQKVFLGEFPMMTPWGTFVINGAERVVVTQIIRSAGAFYSYEKDKKSGYESYSGQIIPTRGAWVQFEASKKDVWHIKVDRKKKLPLTTFLRAIGLNKRKEITDMFGESSYMLNTLDDDDSFGTDDGLKAVYKTLRPNESAPATQDIKNHLAGLFFDPRRYDLAQVGRYKINRKLDCLARLEFVVKNNMQAVFAQDVKTKRGTYIVREGHDVTTEAIEELRKNRELLRVEEVYENLLYAEDNSVLVKASKSDLEFLKSIINIPLTLDLQAPKTKEILVKKGDVITPDLYESVVVKTFDKQVLDPNFKEEMGTVLYEFEKKRNQTVTLEKIAIKFKNSEDDRVIKIVGNNQLESSKVLTNGDIFAAVSYFINLYDGIGYTDDIDHLGNRRLRLVGELLQDEFRKGLAKMEKAIRDKLTSSSVDIETFASQQFINTKTLGSVLRDFFGSSQLSQFMDQINPLSELTHKRRLSALGSGGLSRERAGFEVRDVHATHYGRICPIETSEGQNIGLITSLACYARVNKYGFIETPYFRVQKKGDKMVVTNDIEYFTADIEELHKIAQANMKINENREVIEDRVVARYLGDTSEYPKEEIEYVDVSPQQIISVTTSCIPFLEHDDATRALMGANMQRQAIPLIAPEAPYVGTGNETKAAKDSGAAVICQEDGTVQYADSKKIVVKSKKGFLNSYELIKFERSNASTSINQKPIVTVGEKVLKGDTLADGPSMDRGELALGRNVLVAFMTWDGYNYEDAVIMSERLVQDDVYTSIHIEKYEIEVRKTKIGDEELTNEIEHAPKHKLAKLDENGIVRVGVEVKENDILVGKTTPKGQVDPTPEELLSRSLFSNNSKEVRNTSLEVPHGGGGIVHRVDHFKRDEKTETGQKKYNLGPDVKEKVRVFIVQKRKISEGDKMSGRHGNKGVISKILPQEDMPYLEDGTPIDIMLNPQGIPSRLNIGQVLEVHLGYAAKKLGAYIATPAFDGVENDDLVEIMKEAKMEPDGKNVLYDGRTGEPFDNRINVGVMYMIKLAHMVDDKLHARSEGPYSLVTQQPLGGKAQNGGQKFGEMEVWALEAYGASYTLREMLTLKSDDMVGRNRLYTSIVDGEEIPEPGVPESFRVLVKEMQSLGLSVKLIDKDGKDVANHSIVEDLEIDRKKQKRGKTSEEQKEIMSTRYDKNDEPISIDDSKDVQDFIEGSVK